jgi:hypothetical protein
MSFNFTNETLFTGAFILVIVLFIQYIIYLKLKKIIKMELTKKTTSDKKNYSTQNIQDNKPQLNSTVQIKDIDTYEVDTPDSDDDSYVNPINSEKNIDDETN